ncbi:hypothetical protein CHS0354_007738 [Potamilus streckersoni]|uniref:Delta(3,5)-Delta(2,4)-dienoyl-CoA isomerase, mitochondrial n=1 Tax=Potamilus streckersoni TaxID=2493646 RepID=A0AAE0RSE9_9BIVA|nr:hypothetical protein CHS0354_007738 [Potamilus streckersoni]
MRVLSSMIRRIFSGITFQAPKPHMLETRMMSGGDKNYETLRVMRPREFVVQVEIARPEKKNAMNKAFFSEIRQCFDSLAVDGQCRAIVLSGSGTLFTAGLDLMDLGHIMALMDDPDTDMGRKALKIRQLLVEWQQSFTAPEKCLKPVIAAVHGACIGGGIDLISACDIRYCSQDAWFVIKEIDLGLAADLGTLQRFPKVIGNDSLARELAYTARPFYADEAKQMGFVSRVFQDKDLLIEGALETASLIASKSPIAVTGTKASLVYSRDHTVEEGLNHIGVWNQGMLQSKDLTNAAVALMEKKTPKFSKL